MAATYNQVLIFYRDFNNRTATNFWTVQDQSDAVPAPLVLLAEKVQACSQAAVVAVQWQTTHYFVSAPVNMPYPTVFDRCNMLGRIAPSGVYTHYDLVAPKQSIFLPDNKTLDLANPDVGAMIAQMQATIGSPSGDPLAAIRRGTRQWAGPPA